jgi:hypothetical protein
MLARGIVRDNTTAAGPSGFMKGGMGAISRLSAFRGGTWHGGAHGRGSGRILTTNGAARRALPHPAKIGAKIVIANANAETTFLKLVDERDCPKDSCGVRSIRCESTVSASIWLWTACPIAHPSGPRSPVSTIRSN